MAEVAVLIVKTGFAIVLIALAARFLAQLAQANAYSPMAETVRKITDPFVGPFIRIIPRWGGLDTASLLVMWILQVVMVLILVSLIPRFAVDVSAILIGAVFASIGLLLEVARWSMIIVAIGSWISQGGNPFLSFLSEIIEPVVAPFRKLNLQVGMMDLSYLLAFLVLYIAHGILRAIAYSAVPIGPIRIAFLGV
jgi:YggT family protein